MPFEFTGGQSAAAAEEIQEFRGMLAALDRRINGLETLGHFVGTFDTYGDLLTNASDFEAITINDFINIRADETRDGDITRYIASAIAADGTITWKYDISYDADVSGKLDINGKAADSAMLGGKLPSHYFSLDNVPPAGGVINSPHTWPIWDDVNKTGEIDFGDGSYGKRYAEKIDAPVGSVHVEELETSFNGKIMQSGGFLYTGTGSKIIVLNSNFLSSTAIISYSSGILHHPNTGSLVLQSRTYEGRVQSPYDVWIIYTK